MTSAPDALAAGTQPAWRRWLRRHGWNAAVWILLAALIGYYATLIPKFGSFQVASIVNSGAPLVFLAAAQAVIVIADTGPYPGQSTVKPRFRLWVV